jgi:hypothetical protein
MRYGLALPQPPPLGISRTSFIVAVPDYAQASMARLIKLSALAPFW